MRDDAGGSDELSGAESDDESESDESESDESESDDGGDDDGGDDDHGLLSSVAPEPQTDDSGDEAGLLALDADGDEEDGEEMITTTTTTTTRLPPPRRSANEGAGEGGRGGYTTGGAALHPSARAASSHFQAADALACGPAADLSSSGYYCHDDDGDDEGGEGGEGGEKYKDILSLRPGPGEEDVVLIDHAMVSVWRFPARGDGPRSRRPLRQPQPQPQPPNSSSSSSPPRLIPPPLGIGGVSGSSSSNSAAFSGGDRGKGPSSYPSPRLLARSTYHEIEPYSVARSSDGRTVAIGGDLGLVAFLELERCPRGRGGECPLCSAADAAREAARRQQRRLELLQRRQAARQRQWAAAVTASALRGLPPPPPPAPLTAADVEAELAAAERAEVEEGEREGEGEGEERASRGGSSPASTAAVAATAAASSCLPAHLRPAAVVTLGSLTAVANNNMINGVRFGWVGGKERLVAAVQDRYVYFVDLPRRRSEGGEGSVGGSGGAGGGRANGGGGGGDGEAFHRRSLRRFAAPPPTPPPGSGAVAEALRVVDLTDPNEVYFEAEEAAAAAAVAAAERGRAEAPTTAAAAAAMPPPQASSSSSSTQLRVAPPRTRKLDVYVPASREALEVVPDGRTRTAVAGPFPRAVNLALPSPDGKLLAVVGDFDGAWVLRARQPAPSARGTGGGEGGGKEAGAGAAAAAAAAEREAAPTAAATAPRPGAAAPTPPLARVRRSASAARLASGLRPHPYDATTALRLPFGVASPPRVVCHRGGGCGAGRGGGGAANADRALDPNRGGAGGTHDVVVDVGSQYCAWSPDSSLLAATSDALRAAFVWHVPRGQPLFRVEACGRAALAAAFAPFGFPATFAFAEAARRAFVADLRCGAAGFAKLPPLAGVGGGSGGGGGGEEERGANGNRHRQRSHHQHRRHSSPPHPPHPGPPLSFPRPLSRVCGFGITPSGRILAATRGGLAEWRLAEGWSPRCHADAPPAFRRAARALLCAGAARRASRSREGAGPWSLPTDVLLSIVEMAAQPRGAWVGVGPGGERRALSLAQPHPPPPPSPSLSSPPPPTPPPPQPRPVVRLLAPAGGTTYAAVVAMKAPSSLGGGGGLGDSSAAAARAAAAEAATAHAASAFEEPSAWFSR